ncbi:MAG: aminoacyl-tRNA hydrolase [Planctomycetota bacterium]
MKLIVGLGNPGAKYVGTRHNVGYEVVDVLASRWQISLAAEKFHAWFGKGEICGEPVVLLKPTTFMNRSGRAVVAAGRFYKLELEDLLVVADDLALPLERIRMRPDGSAGSHKGLQSVIDRVGSDRWCRLRVGIGAACGDPTAYVLSRFDEPEEGAIKGIRDRAADAVECWITNGVDLTMTRFNAGPAWDSQGNGQ